MNNFVKYLLKGVKYFMFQTLGEVILIIMLMYLGLPYSEMLVGGEHLYEIIIGILVYHAFFKTVIYCWFYLLVFLIVGLVKKRFNELQLSVINAFLSLLLPIIILLIRHLSFFEMTNVFIATVTTSILIILFVKSSKPI